MENNYGNFVRLLMYNHSKNITTKKADLKYAFKIQNKDIAYLINYAKSKINLLGLELVGINKNKVVDPISSEKYSLRRLYPLESDKSSTVSDLDKKIIIVLFFIFLEGGQIGYVKLIYFCKKINLFKNDSLDDYLMFLKREKYINIFKLEDEMNVEFGYRYFLEYNEFDMLSFLE
ncbi:hypothetical protein AAJ76_1700031022 [Vairimorpha ceranae]|uniref:MAGE domain-containing protein n=1 Tax=Vairimorpha ceranae TaxID=40302 RepID=A0A0F9YSR8_9MICR|nr:hypothetical protein AAJ76_1700031022 [Vairimorpha ceranae]KAF5140882.1 hypothetical protein G9O61_00g008720 [Vairimorpha ceranae]KKO75582.1 hypothetical protein AAJ76_1700031022 [Vairimorpha ceranae]